MLSGAPLQLCHTGAFLHLQAIVRWHVAKTPLPSFTAALAHDWIPTLLHARARPGRHCRNWYATVFVFASSQCNIQMTMPRGRRHTGLTDCVSAHIVQSNKLCLYSSSGSYASLLCVGALLTDYSTCLEGQKLQTYCTKCFRTGVIVDTHECNWPDVRTLRKALPLRRAYGTGP